VEKRREKKHHLLVLDVTHVKVELEIAEVTLHAGLTVSKGRRG
jgi:hypothetical protein